MLLTLLHGSGRPNVLEQPPGVLVRLRLWRLARSLWAFTIVIRGMCSCPANEAVFFLFRSLSVCVTMAVFSDNITPIA